MSKGPCAFCGAEAEHEDGLSLGGVSFGTPHYDCPHCGQYVVGEVLDIELEDDRTHIAFRVACLLRERRLRGEKGLFGVIEDRFQPGERTIEKHLSRWWRVSELLSEFPSPTGILDRTLINLSHIAPSPMARFSVKRPDLPFLTFSADGWDAVLRYLYQMNRIAKPEPNTVDTPLSITPQGWARITELANTRSDSKQAFVALWFGTAMTQFEKAIQGGVEDAGYECRIIKNIEHNNDICDEIIAEIRRSRFVVADFTAGCCKKCDACEEKATCRDRVRPRGGVYFEAGFALGLGIPVIWTVRKDQLDHVHFDTRQYNYIDYETADELRQRLRNRIAATIH